ncbi:hypothetical protein VNI00_018173 [Paramarasmius palmivorus]|uniref:Uncharacterized protein n=1 Tax=Paramarasmius palmivorus TaxID=297713 RepID=A0AAW0B3S8_9AGAR
MRLRFSALLLCSVPSIASAITIDFPQPLIAVRNNTFSWTRAEKDPQNFHLRKKKLDDSSGFTSFSGPVNIPVNGMDTGSGMLYFNRAGLFQVAAFASEDKRLQTPLFSTIVTVSLNPTSAGAAPVPSPTNNVGDEKGADTKRRDKDEDKKGDGDGDGDGDGKGKRKRKGGKGKHGKAGNTNMTKSNPQRRVLSIEALRISDLLNSETPPTASSKKPNVPLIVGSTLGSVGVILMVAAALLFFRYKRRNQTLAFERNMITRNPQAALPPRLNTTHAMSDGGSDNSSSKNLTFNSPMSLRRYSQLPPAPDVQSIASSGSFSLTSPIVARQRDAERNRAARDALNNFRLSMSTTTTNSRSTSSRLSSKAGTSSSITSFPVPALPPRTRTTRQMLIEEKIQLFQSKILLLQSRKISTQTAEYDAEMDRLGQRVERLKQIHESDWALDLTNVAPEGLHD